MKLTLFSQNVTDAHKQKLRTFFTKPLEEVKFLYINTPGNYKPYKSEWMIKGEQRWRDIFPKFQEFDLERAIRVNPNFDFKAFLSSYDFVFSSGGRFYILLYWMHKTGSLKILKDLILQDKVVYGGESAGALVVYKDLDTYKTLDDPTLVPEKIDEGLGLVDFAPLPHWQNEEFQSGLQEIKSNFEVQNVKVVTFGDNQAMFIEDDKVEII